MRSEEREDSPEGNHRRRRERDNPPEDEEQREVAPEAQDPPEDDEWNFLGGEAEDLEMDDDPCEDSRSDESGVTIQSTRATVFDRLKRSAPEGRARPPASKRPAS